MPSSTSAVVLSRLLISDHHFTSRYSYYPRLYLTSKTDEDTILVYLVVLIIQSFMCQCNAGYAVRAKIVLIRLTIFVPRMDDGGAHRFPTHRGTDEDVQHRLGIERDQRPEVRTVDRFGRQ